MASAPSRGGVDDFACFIRAYDDAAAGEVIPASGRFAFRRSLALMKNLRADYRYDSLGPTWSNLYLWEPLEKIIEKHATGDRRIFEVGCGNGATANLLAKMGFSVTAIDPSESGMEIAKRSYQNITFESGSAYDELSRKYGTFPIVVSLEVIEHCFFPRIYAKTIYDLLEPQGVAIISTPYHGYLKNLALALANKFDHHFNPLWDGGHIKFWSENTLRKLLAETGFKSTEFVRVGRIPSLARSMIAIAVK